MTACIQRRLSESFRREKQVSETELYFERYGGAEVSAPVPIIRLVLANGVPSMRDEEVTLIPSYFVDVLSVQCPPTEI
jgi:hypothetical protein